MALWDFVVENVEAWREEINDYLALRQGESDETANTTYIEFNETVRRFVAFVAKTELSRYNDEAFRAEKALKGTDHRATTGIILRARISSCR